MADTFTKEQRSQIMRQVKSNRNKSTELKLIQFFKDNSIKGWRRSYNLFGRPDFVFPLAKKVVLLTAVFGMDTTVATQNPKTIKNTGYKRFPVTKNETEPLIKHLHQMGGQ